MSQPASDGTFAVGQELWLARLGNLRNVLRQELINRQLAQHLPDWPARILDVGAGQGTQAIRLASTGHQVIAVEPDARMRETFQADAQNQPVAVQQRIELRTGRFGELAAVLDDQVFDAVLCHGVLMYLADPKPAMAELTARVAPGGLLSVAARCATFLPWRPLQRGDLAGAQAAFAELDAARAEGRYPRYINEIGSPARADSVEGLTALCETGGLHQEAWYGVRVGSTDSDLAAPVPDTESELAALLDVQERLGRTDPYRQLAALFHLIARRPG
ncbi:MAG TPA: methyltransferase domain-containing protein [Jatrophihabitans sp.]|nr:methyltransferase domain-containing protein [Jatrophihabitans sp.]